MTEDPDNGQPGHLADPDNGQQGHLGLFSLRAQFYWILPITLATVSLVIWLLANPQWGGAVAAIVTIPINVAAVLVPLLMTYSARGARPNRGNRVRMRRLKVALAFTTAALMVMGLVYWVSREEDPQDYLAGVLRVGVLKEGYPGWNSVRTDGTREGFDVALVEFIARRFPKVERVEYVELTSREDRVRALTDDFPDGPVHIVVANFSMTPDREETIDFAGPYYYDKQGFFTWQKASNLEEIAPGEVCTASGTTGNARLTELGWQPSAERSLVACMRQFLENRDSGRAVSTDVSILQAFAEDRKQDSQAPWQEVSTVGIGQESYGVGIPNNRPRLCEALNRTITEFLNDHWAIEFDKHLKGVTSKDEHIPKATSPCRGSPLF
ncbi:MAG: transporter substrate-binding domain-containing protein [Saccharothrix sp.]|nr:transporter substrate-binding domain-containing protein [Saccharothrix sp.]